jgi:hypothetical protein
MPVRHCVFVADLAEMEKAFQLPLDIYVDEFLERPSPGDKMRDYAELAFSNEEQIQTLRRQDRDTMVMARRLMATGAGPRSELPIHMKDATADYARTRTASQFKWLLHAFAGSGRSWIKEFLCSSGREWVEESVNLLFTQRAFSSTPEEAEEYKLTREALLRLTGPFPVKEAAADVEDGHVVTADEFPWCPREDGIANFRLVPSFQIPTVARTLGTLEFGPEAFGDTGRQVAERLQQLTREHCARLRAFLTQPYARPALLAFIGS